MREFDAKLLSKCCLATLLNPLGGRTTYVVGLGVLSGVSQPRAQGATMQWVQPFVAWRLTASRKIKQRRLRMAAMPGHLPGDDGQAARTDHLQRATELGHGQPGVRARFFILFSWRFDRE